MVGYPSGPPTIHHPSTIIIVFILSGYPCPCRHGEEGKANAAGVAPFAAVKRVVTTLLNMRTNVPLHAASLDIDGCI